MQIGFVGVGNMGGAMAARILESGHSLVVHDLDRTAARPILSRGGAWAESPGAVAEQCEVICSMLPGPEEMEEAALGRDGILEGIQANAIYIDHTTNSPALVKRVGDAAAQKNANMLDAPVMGDRQSISRGVLTIIVGGESEVFDRAAPILGAVGDEVIRVGPLGAGSVTKISLNALAMGVDLLATECLTLAVKAGVGLGELLEVMDRGKTFGENSSVKTRLPETLFKGEFLPSRFFLKLAYKDFRLFHDLAVENRVPSRLVSLCEMEMLEALNRGWGDRERVISSTLQEQRSNTELRLDGGGREQR